MKEHRNTKIEILKFVCFCKTKPDGEFFELVIYPKKSVFNFTGARRELRREFIKKIIQIISENEVKGDIPNNFVFEPQKTMLTDFIC